VGTLAKGLNVDAEAVMEIFAADSKLHFANLPETGLRLRRLLPPEGYSRPELPCQRTRSQTTALESIMPSNEEHLDRAVELVLGGQEEDCHARFKLQSCYDDLRESPQVQLVKRLLGEGQRVQI
jgi:GDP-mannose 6-dehydrogenase